MKAKGRIFVLSGPSGSGKTTLHERLLNDKTIKLKRSISYTTRVKRQGEHEGKDYFFVSRREFLQKLKREEFLEHQKVFDSLYGTPHSFVQNSLRRGRDILLCIDVKGALVVKKYYPEAVMIFIAPPSIKELSKRLDKRSTESRSSKQLRLKIARKELAYKKYYDYVVVNDRISSALRKIKQIIRKVRKS